MSLVALTSAKHSPGATTAALALAATWPPPRRALVVECDPAGGDLAAQQGLALDPGLTSLAAASRHGLNPTATAAHVQPLAVGVDALIAPASNEQTHGALSVLSDRLGPALANLDGMDAIADCGRLDLRSPVIALLGRADVVLLVARPTVVGVEHIRVRVQALRGVARKIGVVLVGDRPYGAREVAECLRCEVVGVLAHDPKGAEALNAGATMHSLRRSPLVRSARSLSEHLVRALASGSEETPQPAPDSLRADAASPNGRSPATP